MMKAGASKVGLARVAAAALVMCAAPVRATPSQVDPSAESAPAALDPRVDSQPVEQSGLTDTPRRLDGGFEWGLRSGLELGIGKIDSGIESFRRGALNSVAAYRVPLRLDLGYRVSPSWWLGAQAQAGSGAFGSSCPDGGECEWSDVRLGAQAIFHLSPQSRLDPWLGLVAGWEWLRGSITQTFEAPPIDGMELAVPFRASEVRGGPQLVAEGGLSFDVGRGLKIGPYLSAAGGVYATSDFECRLLNSGGAAALPEELQALVPDCDAQEEADAKLHGWIGIGLRATHGP